MALTTFLSEKDVIFIPSSGSEVTKAFKTSWILPIEIFWANLILTLKSTESWRFSLVSASSFSNHLLEQGEGGLLLDPDHTGEGAGARAVPTSAFALSNVEYWIHWATLATHFTLTWLAPLLQGPEHIVWGQEGGLDAHHHWEGVEEGMNHKNQDNYQESSHFKYLASKLFSSKYQCVTQLPAQMPRTYV